MRPSGCVFWERYAKLNCASKWALPGDNPRIYRASAEVAFVHLIRCCAEALSLRECRENQLLVSNEGLPAGLDRVSCVRPVLADLRYPQRVLASRLPSPRDLGHGRGRAWDVAGLAG